MDTRTGELHSEEEMKRLTEEFERDSADFVKINPNFMTMMQSMSHQVSLKDHRSKLGKQLTKQRKIRNFNTRKR